MTSKNQLELCSRLCVMRCMWCFLCGYCNRECSVNMLRVLVIIRFWRFLISSTKIHYLTGSAHNTQTVSDWNHHYVRITLQFSSFLYITRPHVFCSCIKSRYKIYNSTWFLHTHIIYYVAASLSISLSGSGSVTHTHHIPAIKVYLFALI